MSLWGGTITTSYSRRLLVPVDGEPHLCQQCPYRAGEAGVHHRTEAGLEESSETSTRTPRFLAMGQNPNRSPSEHPNPTTKIGCTDVERHKRIKQPVLESSLQKETHFKLPPEAIRVDPKVGRSVCFSLFVSIASQSKQEQPINSHAFMLLLKTPSPPLPQKTKKRENPGAN